jgi:ankyrin repeat protein
MQGHVEVMQTLRKFGAQVDVPNNSNWTPLHRAAYCGFPAACEWLLNNAASIYAVNK